MCYIEHDYIRSINSQVQSSLGVTYIYAFFTVTLCSILFIVSMTFDRFYSIIQPQKAASFNTVKRAKITIACIVMFSLLFNVPHFFISSHQGWLCLPFGNVIAMAKGYSKFYYWLSLALQFLLPFVLLLIMNSFIIRTLQKRLLKKVSLKEDKDDTQNKFKSPERQVYIILLLVTFSFLILTTPPYLFFIINLLGNFTTSPKVFCGYYLYSNVTQKLHVTNYGINFFLYVISGRKFRVNLLKVFRLQIKSPNMSIKSSSSPETEVSAVLSPTQNSISPTLR